jgi:outer membrane lipoprotein-sorting protein
MKKKIILFGLVLFSLILFNAVAGVAASFTAKVVETRNGKVKTGKIYCQGHRYRLEAVESGREVVVIADRRTKRHQILDIRNRTFFELPSDDFEVLANDPFQASEYIAAKYGVQPRGQEEISGFPCEKQVVISRGQKIMTRWFSPALSFPVKIIMHQGTKDAVARLEDIRKGTLRKSLFVPPAGYTLVEAPGVAAKHRREELEREEAALTPLRKRGRDSVPCRVKMGPGGELRVPVDMERSVEIEAVNEIQGESVVLVIPFRKGKKVANIGVSPWTLKGNGSHRTREFNDSFSHSTGSFEVDEVRIKVEKGLVYASVTQRGPYRTDLYNRGRLQNGAETKPDRKLTILIRGDNPFGPETRGRMLLKSEGGGAEKVDFTVKNGRTRTWHYPATRKIRQVDFIIKAGEGRAKISLIQPAPPKAAAKGKHGTFTGKSTKRSQATPRDVSVFTVKYPSGRGKGVSPRKDLKIVLTGITAGASGNIDLYSDRKKKSKIDSFRFKLDRGEIKSFAYAKERHVGWVTVWVMKGSFSVRLDQSPQSAGNTEN